MTQTKLSLKSSLVIVVAVILTGCHSENPFISKELAEAILKEKEIKPVEYAAAILNNDVYWIHNFDQEPKKITQSSSVVKKQVRLSHDHSKIAYLNSLGSPVIIDTLGTVISQVTSFKSVKQMDWGPDDETLWMLIGNELKFYGQSLDVPDLDIEPEDKILSAIITPESDVLYVVQTLIGLNQYTERLEIRSVDGSARTINKEFGEIRHMQSVRLSKDGNYFVVGYTETTDALYLVKMEGYVFSEDFPDFTYDNDRYIDPVFDFNSSYIVTATSDNSDDNFYLTALYTKNEAIGDDHSKYMFDYTAKSGSVYVDWK